MAEDDVRTPLGGRQGSAHDRRLVCVIRSRVQTRRPTPFKAADSRVDRISVRRRPIPECELVTVRVGNDTTRHAMKRNGSGMCAEVGLVRTFGSGSSEIVKMADGTGDVNCSACAWGIRHDGVFAFPYGKLL